MKILFSALGAAQAGFDCAERKGIGHPDTLADLIADTFSREYSRWCLKEFGVIPNHWVDKVTLVGAASHVAFGSFTIARPVQCHLIGKITEQVGDRPIPLMELFEQATLHVMAEALGGTSIWPHLLLFIASTSGTAVDHDARFYAPGGPEDLRKVLRSETVANDTVICTGSSGPGPAGRLAIWLEEHIRHIAPAQIGTDVKTLVVRQGDRYDVTAAVPVHPETVQSWREYADLIDAFRDRLKSDLAARCDAELHLNTKDRAERGYLAPFGTALGKGDCGVVGRGNRAYGVIEPLRPAGCEAPAGKTRSTTAGRSTALWLAAPHRRWRPRAAARPR
ncbi:hypothetical protein Acor_54820 [Acrocarpospora corrugata]|uniref:S-adenosylmethionine synthetase n=1 Tax=Acrocarpospora corrugata TaxID=35763 RepID=A0A5M3W3U4_9ACTN|nr:methionine adenosyltransferase [Acrocarpospora corrugata]GES03416.1 hypothetical protein Acor_54820 [Acrocarpospora corrugata]